jgi:hypothetical protein
MCLIQFLERSRCLFARSRRQHVPHPIFVHFLHEHTA